MNGTFDPGTELSAARRSGTFALVAAILGSSMLFVDGTAVNVALPILQRDFNATSAAVQWIVEGYALFLSALILLGGSLGDVYGRRAVFGWGIGIFAFASLLCAIAPNVDMLIAARCLQGAGGALSAPGSLALISANFGDAERGRAIGTWSAFSAMTSAVGPVLGGWLVQAGSWRYVFFINLPLAALVFVILPRVTESRDAAAPRRLDVAGAVLATLGLGSLVYGLIGAQTATPDASAFPCIGAGAALLAAFVFVEMRVPAPMMQPALFRSRAFSAANLYTLLLYAALGGSLYYIPFDLINVQGYPPAAAGAALLPFVVILFSLSRFSGGLIARVGARGPLVLGAVLAAGGFALFAFAGIGRSYWVSFFPAAVLLGFGGAFFVAPLTTLVMGSVPASHAGVASGINNAVSRAAGLIAVAALGIALAHAFEAGFERDLARAGRISAPTLAAVQVGRAQIIAGHVPPAIGAGRQHDLVAAAIKNAFDRGFRVAMLCGAGLALLAALLAGVFIAPGPLRRLATEG
jgi:EmrB/QacA subfamily drug resistance transporter